MNTVSPVGSAAGRRGDAAADRVLAGRVGPALEVVDAGGAAVARAHADAAAARAVGVDRAAGRALVLADPVGRRARRPERLAACRGRGPRGGPWCRGRRRRRRPARTRGRSPPSASPRCGPGAGSRCSRCQSSAPFAASRQWTFAAESPNERRGRRGSASRSTGSAEPARLAVEGPLLLAALAVEGVEEAVPGGHVDASCRTRSASRSRRSPCRRSTSGRGSRRSPG